MLYSILRPITRIVLRGYYRKIFVHGQQKIPVDQPVILAVNHPSAFTEPCLLATHLDRELHFLIRGDIINPRVKWFFDETNQLPIYRFRDGFSSMRRNEKQFSYCFDLLAKSGCIVIFAEGSTQHIKRTRPIQKGAARIAFGALQNRNLEDVWIVPVGVNFEHSPRPRSLVAVEIGEPISTRAIFDTFEKDERKGLNELTRIIFKGLRPQMIHIGEDSRIKLANDLLLWNSHDRHYSMYPVADYGESDFFHEQDLLAKKINEMPAGQWSELSELAETYKDKLSDAGVTDVGRPTSQKANKWWILWTPFAVLGGLFLGPVQWISFKLQQQLNQKDEYISGFRMAGFLVFVPLFIVIWIILLWPVMGWWAMSLIFILPVLSMLAVWWLDGFKALRQQQKWNQLPYTHRKELVEMREQIMRKVRSK